MKYIFATTVIMSAFIALPANASEAVVAAGKKLVETQCQQCHDNAIYTRKNSIIQSLPELKARVEFCENANNKHWADSQINQVVDYLNSAFYKYPAK